MPLYPSRLSLVAPPNDEMDLNISDMYVLCRNPNAPPSEWWGPDKKWPRVARPAVGALIEVKHLMPSNGE